MKIFFIATKLNFNKGGSMVENDLTCRKMRELGNEITMLTLFPEHNDFPPNLIYRVIEEPVGKPSQFNIQRGVFWLMKKYENEADIFYIEGQTFFYGAGFYRWSGGRRPVIAYFVREQVSWPENISAFFFEPRSDNSLFYSLKRKIRRLIEKYVFMYFGNFCDFLTWGSPLLLEEYEEFGLKTKGKSMIIGDPYPYDETMRKYGITENFYAERKRNGDKVVLFYSNRMEPGKGFDILIKAFSKVKNKDKFRLVLGGDGSERRFVESAIKDLDLECYVELPGWIPKEEFHKSFQQADIFIYPRWRTAQPSLGLVEAMTFGLPTIVPAHTGLNWVAGKSALTFELDNIDDLAAKIELLGSKPEMRKRLSRECYIRIRQADIDYKKTIPAILKTMKRFVKKENSL